MAVDADRSAEIAARVAAAAGAGTPLAPVGGDTKAFYGNPVEAEPLPVGAHRGIIDHDPAELVVTVRAGTPLTELEAALAGRNQHLAFEPPRLGAASTIGGSIAAGLAGPARPWSGPVRDHLLGVRIATGEGELLSFGGRVIKNVAGYDVSRAFAGSLGCLGVLLDLHLRTTPRPATVLTLVQQTTADAAIAACAGWRRAALPLTGACHGDGRLSLRLQGAAGAVARAAAVIGGDRTDDDAFWTALRDQALPFFTGATDLWRLSMPPATAMLPLDGEWLVDWGGAQRWLRTTASAATVQGAAAAAGGSATLYRSNAAGTPRFRAPAAAIMAISRRLKQAFDPHGILSPGRLHPGL